MSGVAAVLLLALAAPSPASATPAEPGATLTLSWSAPEVSLQVFTVTVTCSPNTGGEDVYADVDAICADVATAGGDFNALPGYPFMNCTGYQGWKIRTTATGTWFGAPVSHDVLHANICEAKKATGRVIIL